MAYQLNGSTQYLEVGTAVISSFPFTFSAVVNASTFSNGPIAIALDNSGTATSSAIMLYSNSGACRIGVENGGSSIYLNSAGTVATNVSATLTGVFTSSQLTSYINGGSSATVAHSVAMPSLDRTRVGAYRFSGILGNYLSGFAAEPAIWNVALTDAEIASLAAGFTPDQIRPQSLQFYAPLVRDLVDLRGGRAITNVNSATVATHPRIIT